MAFRYLIYRTDYGDTIVRESPVSGTTTGGTEQELFTNFVIPEIQPLYLWRITGGTDVVPNTDQNINAWLNNTYPPSPDEAVTYSIYTGFTASTNANFAYISGITDNKIDKVTGATDNIAIFVANGNVKNSGYSISDVLASSGGTPLLLFTGFTASTNANFAYISGVTNQNTSDISYISGITSQNVSDIAYLGTLSGLTANAITGVTNGLTKVGNHDAKLGGIFTEDTYIDGDYSLGFGSYSVPLSSFDAVAGDSGYTNYSRVRVHLSCSTLETYNGGALKAQVCTTVNGVVIAGKNGGTTYSSINVGEDTAGSLLITDNRTTATGIQYAADYSSNYTDRSLVDKAYADSIATGLDWKQSVKLTTTSGDTNLDLTGGTFGGSIDGIAVQNGWRVLIKNQDSAKEQNGIYTYILSASTFVRTSDFDGTPAGEVTNGAITYTETGTTNGGTAFILITPDPITIGVTPLTFTIFTTSGGLTAGVGIKITNKTNIDFDGASVAGTYLQWTGTQLNVTGLTSQIDFTSFTASTASNFSYLSGVTDQNSADISYLSTFSGQTTTDISYISGITTQNTVDINYISGITDTKLDSSVFTAYTGATVANELFLIHTGGTSINNVAATSIVWHSGVTVGSAYSFTGGSHIYILTSGTYEITYNIPFNAGSNNDITIGGNLVLNGLTTIALTSTAGMANRIGAAGSVSLPSINLTLSANDRLDLVMFRTGQSGTGTSAQTGSILIKKKGRLQ